MRIIITRPQEDAGPLAEHLEELGAKVILEPLLSIEYLDGPELNLDGAQAFLITSANGVRALARRCTTRALPIYAVGDASARTAKDLGFTKIVSACGDVAALAQTVADNLEASRGSLIHAAGSKLAGDLKGLVEAQNFDYQRQVLYRAHKAEHLSKVTVEALKKGEVDGALFFSPRTARAFAELLQKAGLASACQNAVAFCLSPAVAAELKELSWRDVRIAANPDQDSLLATVKAIC